MKDLFDNLAAVAGVATLALLLFAVCYEYGYFWTIGSEFQTFASTTDYFTNSTQWILFALFLVSTWTNWRSLLKEDFSKFDTWQSWIAPAITVPIFVCMILFTNISFALPLFALLSVAWMTFLAYVMPRDMAAEPLFQHFRHAVVIVPVLALFAFMIGHMRGQDTLTEHKPPYKINVAAE